MKLKTSITLSADLVAKLDRLVGPDVSRSSFIEGILRAYVELSAQSRRNARDVAAINRHAARLNADMRDALSFQVLSDDG